MKVLVYNPYSKDRVTFQGDEEAVFEQLLEHYGYLQNRAKTLDEAIRHLSHQTSLMVSVE